MFEKLLDATRTAEWKAIIALGRIGGLRISSELATLRWSDIDWDKNRMRIRNLKTGKSTGRPFRESPLFPRLRYIL